jgi:hypothetical protein
MTAVTTSAAAAADPYLAERQYALIDPVLAAADPRTPEHFLLMTPVVSTAQVLAMLSRTDPSPDLVRRFVNLASRRRSDEAVRLATQLPGLTCWQLWDLCEGIEPRPTSNGEAGSAVLDRAFKVGPLTAEPGAAETVVARVLCSSSWGARNELCRKATRGGSLVPAALRLMDSERDHARSTPHEVRTSVLTIVTALDAAIGGDRDLRWAVATIGADWSGTRATLLAVAADITAAPAH